MQLTTEDVLQVFSDGHDRGKEEPAQSAGEQATNESAASGRDGPARSQGAPEQAARKAGAVAQFAGGVPAMCDGVTQGQTGMELSLFSRDVIAMATAVSLSHNVFDGVLCLGVCDKIVPGLLIGALQFGHLPTIFVPGGPMTSGLSNPEKSRIRQLYTEGKVSRGELLDAEMKSYHGPGTCTFYGTANSNQMLMEMMGLHLPGAAFVNPNTPLRDALTAAAAQRCAAITALGDQYIPMHEVIDERAIVNGIVGLLATGGSTNHTIHLVAVAGAAGIVIDWSDFDELSAVVPLLARVYPNGSADVNHFHAAGGMGFLVRELLQAGLVHPDVNTVMGPGLEHYTREPFLKAVEGGAQPWDLIREHQLAFYKRQLGDRKAVVLGASLGGAVALDFAATHPECAPRAASTTRSISRCTISLRRRNSISTSSARSKEIASSSGSTPAHKKERKKERTARKRS